MPVPAVPAVPVPAAPAVPVPASPPVPAPIPAPPFSTPGTPATNSCDHFAANPIYAQSSGYNFEQEDLGYVYTKFIPFRNMVPIFHVSQLSPMPYEISALDVAQVATVLAVASQQQNTYDTLTGIIGYALKNQDQSIPTNVIYSNLTVGNGQSIVTNVLTSCRCNNVITSSCGFYYPYSSSGGDIPAQVHVPKNPIPGSTNAQPLCRVPPARKQITIWFQRSRIIYSGA